MAIVAAATRATWEPARSARVLGPLNVRSGPGTEYPVVGHVIPGETIEISHPDTRGWAAVRRGTGTVGYVRALPRYVRIDEAPEPRSAGGGGVWWVAGGLAAAGALVLNRGRSRRMSAPVARAWTTDSSPADAWPQGHTAHSGFAAATAAVPELVDESSERNGREFEDWAARRLGTAPFHLIDWRGDKYVDGVFAESTLAPDLLVEYRDGPERTRYAVECKWRRRFWDDVLWWGEWKHLHRYQRYAADQKVPYTSCSAWEGAARPRTRSTSSRWRPCIIPGCSFGSCGSTIARAARMKSCSTSATVACACFPSPADDWIDSADATSRGWPNGGALVFRNRGAACVPLAAPLSAVYHNVPARGPQAGRHPYQP